MKVILSNKLGLTPTSGGGTLKSMNRKAYGFTIVELLIVVVVIAILATISIVAYKNISNSASDSAVKSDLRNLSQIIHLWELENNKTAVLTYSPVASASLGPGITFAPNKRAHSADYVLYVCRQTSNPSNLVIGSRSASNKVFAYQVGQGFIDYPNPESTLNGNWGSGSTNCPRLLGATAADYTFTYAKGNNEWTGWVK